MAKNQTAMQIIRVNMVDTPASMLTIKPGTSATIRCADFSKLGTVKSAATRLNQRSGYKEFEVRDIDNGAIIIIKRNIRKDENN